jgi:hypothetical protein
MEAIHTIVPGDALVPGRVARFQACVDLIACVIADTKIKATIIPSLPVAVIYPCGSPDSHVHPNVLTLVPGHGVPVTIWVPVMIRSQPLVIFRVDYREQSLHSSEPYNSDGQHLIRELFAQSRTCRFSIKP